MHRYQLIHTEALNPGSTIAACICSCVLLPARLRQLSTSRKGLQWRGQLASGHVSRRGSRRIRKPNQFSSHQKQSCGRKHRETWCRPKNTSWKQRRRKSQKKHPLHLRKGIYRGRERVGVAALLNLGFVTLVFVSSFLFAKEYMLNAENLET